MGEAERQAFELSLVPELMLRAHNGVSMPAHPDAQRAFAELVAARDAARAGLALPQQAEVARVAGNFVDEVHRAAKFPDRVGLVAFHFAKILTDAEAIAIGDASPLGRALAIMLPALEPAAADARLDEAARKQAVRTLRAAQRLGLFPDLQLDVRTA